MLDLSFSQFIKDLHVEIALLTLAKKAVVEHIIEPAIPIIIHKDLFLFIMI